MEKTKVTDELEAVQAPLSISETFEIRIKEEPAEDIFIESESIFHAEDILSADVKVEEIHCEVCLRDVNCNDILKHEDVPFQKPVLCGHCKDSHNNYRDCNGNLFSFKSSERAKSDAITSCRNIKCEPPEEHLPVLNYENNWLSYEIKQEALDLEEAAQNDHSQVASVSKGKSKRGKWSTAKIDFESKNTKADITQHRLTQTKSAAKGKSKKKNGLTKGQSNIRTVIKNSKESHFQAGFKQVKLPTETESKINRKESPFRQERWRKCKNSKIEDGPVEGNFGFDPDYSPKKKNRVTKTKTPSIGQRKAREFKCHLCVKDFDIKSSLVRHMITHTGDKPYKCKICQALFTQLGSLNKHLNAHKDYRPHVCETCGKTFTQKYILNKHMRCHTGERPFSCDYCEKKFTQKYCLSDHLRTKHDIGSLSFGCEFCHRKFPRKRELVQHLKRHFREWEEIPQTYAKDYLTCKFCPEKVFYKRRELEKHVIANLCTNAPKENLEAQKHFRGPEEHPQMHRKDYLTCRFSPEKIFYKRLELDKHVTADLRKNATENNSPYQRQ